MPGIFLPDTQTDDPPKFSDPIFPCPTTQLVTFLKQVNRSQLSKAEIAILDATFGGFLTGVKPPGTVSEIVARFAAESGLSYEHQERMPRRYDGDPTLPTGRYSTVCKDASGDDGGTLIRELHFYANAAVAEGHVEVYDPAVGDHGQRIGQFGLDPEARERIVLRYLSFAQADGSSAPMSLLVSIPVIIREVRIENVLDLRRPAAAQWLCWEISRLTFGKSEGEKFRCFPNRTDLTEFVELLPALMDQAKGGGNVHRIVGLYLRQLGINGLVFPAVRGNASVQFDHGEPTDFHGWSFVDFREAPPAKTVAFFELRPEWPTTLVIEGGDDGGRSAAAFSEAVSFQVEGYAEGTGQMAVTGVEARMEVYHLVDSLEAVIRYRLPEVSDADINNLKVFLVSIPIQYSIGIAVMSLWSLLGLQQARADLMAFIEANFSQHPLGTLLTMAVNPPPVSVAQLASSKLFMAALGGGGR